MTPDDYQPADDLTPIQPVRVVEDKTTRRIVCPRCKTLVEIPPIAWPLRPTTKALVHRPLTPWPLDPQDETVRMERPPEG